MPAIGHRRFALEWERIVANRKLSAAPAAGGHFSQKFA
jgi:hypothetical protein